MNTLSERHPGHPLRGTRAVAFLEGLVLFLGALGLETAGSDAVTVRLELRPEATGQPGIRVMRPQLAPSRTGRVGLGLSGKKPQSDWCW